VIGLVAGATLALMAACTQADDDVPSLTPAVSAGAGTAPAASEPEEEATSSSTWATPTELSTAIDVAGQVERAEAYLACLTDADLPAAASTEIDGQLFIYWREDVPLMARWPGESGNMAQNVPAGTNWPLPDDDGPALIVNGVDRTADLRRCLASSGYTEPVVDEVLVAQTQDRMNRLMAGETNDFLACARENGYPTLPDVSAPPVEPGGDPIDSAPQAAILPLSMTVDDLRALLEACRPYDPAIDRPIWDGHGAANPILPALAIESPPGGIGDGKLETDPVARHYGELDEALREAEGAFWEAFSEGQ
jgi:hypothetical protein